MTTLTDWREELKSTRRKCAAEKKDLVAKYRESTGKLKKELKRLGLESSYHAEQDARKKLQNVFYSNWLSASYPTVDLSFADSKLQLLVERVQSGAKIVGIADREANRPVETIATIDRFAKQKADGRRDLLAPMPEPKCQLGRFSFSSFQRNGERFRDFSGNVFCNRPAGSPPSLIKRLRDIVAISMEAQAAAIRGGAGITNAELGRMFLWLPRLEDLYIEEEIPVRDDPAVLVTIGERAHLVGFWDSPNEDPIEGLLREFSEGPFVK
jgi:hypothetical protein